MRRLLVLSLFLLSGAAGLVYQVVWMRQLSLVFGVTSHAVSTVLAVFMGGLAIGSWLFGRAGDDTRSPLRFYGWLELGIALFGFQSILLLDGLRELYVELRRSGAIAPELFPVVRVALACLALLGPTTLMGATLPVLLRGVCKSRERLARDSGLLYGLNTLGAVAGVLVAAFWLIEAVGVRNTTFVAAGLNLVVAAVALALARGERADVWSERPAPDPVPAERHHVRPVGAGTRRLVLAAFAVSGFLALAYEVLWTRYLVYAVGQNSVYAFATMLAAFLLGIALGSLVVALVADWIEGLVPLLGFVMVLIGASAVGTVALMNDLAHWTAARHTGSFWSDTAVDFALCVGVLIVPTTLSGATFAIVAKICARDPARFGRDVGGVYAANTAGAIAGALAGGFVILPQLGLVHGLYALAGVGALVGLVLLLARPAALPVVGAVAGVALLAASVVWVRGAGDPRDLLYQGSDEQRVFYADGPESSVAVVESLNTGDVHLVVNGDHQAGTDPTQQIHLRLLGHLPALFHADPKRGMVVGFGAGVATGCLAQHPLERVDQVELSPDVIEASVHFAPYNHDPLADGSIVEVHFDDGRNFLLTTDERWDVITSDPIDPDDAGVTSLYSAEYFRLIRARLHPGGIACQWISEQYDPEDFRLLVRTFQSVFPYTTIWDAHPTIVLLGSVDPPTVTMGELRERVAREPIAESLAVVGVDSAEALLSLLVTGSEATRRFTGEGELNTDDRPRIEYRGPRRAASRYGGNRELWADLVALRDPDLGGLVAGWSEADRAALAPHFARMGALYAVMDERALARAESSGERAPRPAEEREAAASAYLEATWSVLADPDTARIHRLIAGVDRADPADGAEARAAGLAAFAAGDFAAAREAFLGAPEDDYRATVLAAACLERQGDAIGCLEDLLHLDLSGVNEWSYLYDLVPHAATHAIGTLAGASEEEFERLAALFPLDEDPPPRRASMWGELTVHASAPPPPSGSDVDAWRAWYAWATWRLFPHGGRFAWRYL